MDGEGPSGLLSVSLIVWGCISVQLFALEEQNKHLHCSFRVALPQNNIKMQKCFIFPVKAEIPHMYFILNPSQRNK